MMRSWMALLALTAASPLAWAAEPAPADPKASTVSREDILRKESLLAARFRQFEDHLQTLAQQMERSDKPQDRARAAGMRKAMEAIQAGNMSVRFDRMLKVLRESKGDNLNEITTALAEGEQLAQDLQDLIDILLSDSEYDARHKKIKRLLELVRMLDGAIRSEKMARAHVEMGKLEAPELVEIQTRATEKANQLDRTLAEQKKLSLEQLPKQDLVGKAVIDEREAGQRLEKANKDAASEKQSEAIVKLMIVRDALETLLRQLRDNERTAILENLTMRCEKLLRMQQAIREESDYLTKEIAMREGGRTAREDEQKAQILAEREGLVIRELGRALDIVNEDGTAVAFAEVLSQLTDDAKAVQRRLAKIDLGRMTDSIQGDVTTTLKEMIEALKKPEKDKDQTAAPKPGAPVKQPPLVGRLTELKLIRSMQSRVNNRTVEYGKMYKGEEPENVAIRDEVRNLSDRQGRITRVTQLRTELDIEENRSNEGKEGEKGKKGGGEIG
jgi:hypothetical protein